MTVNLCEAELHFEAAMLIFPQKTLIQGCSQKIFGGGAVRKHVISEITVDTGAA